MEIWSIKSISTVFILFVTALILLYLYFDWKFKYWQRKGLKSPTFLDSLRNIRKSLSQPVHEGIVTAYEKYGRLFGVYGPLPQVFVAEPDLIKQILVKDFHVFRNRLVVKKNFFVAEEFQKMLSILCDEDWKRVRCLMSPTFSSSKMRKMAALVKECSCNAAIFFRRMAEKGEELDVKKYFGPFAVDVIATTAFATKINSLDDPNNEFVVNARNLSNRNVSLLKSIIVSLAPRLSKFLGIRLFPIDTFKYFQRIVKKILEDREKTKTKGYDFLQLMMDAKDGYIENSAEDAEDEVIEYQNLPKHKTMTLEEIISQCVMFFIAGHDTTIVTLSFVAYHLALYPDCQEKLAKEIQDTWEKNGTIDFDIVSKMPYLEAVLCESLRIKSTATLLMRMSTEDYVLGDTGVTLPKGTSVIIPIYAMHRDPEWFPEPEKFDPDRFLPENKHLIKPFTYLPFGDGPRNCIGMRYVVMAMKLCLVYMLKEIKFIATEETRKPIEYYYGQGVLQAKRIPLKVEKRCSQTSQF